jgi:HTH-type transcriptional regulator/antitoxin HigA
MTIKPIKTKKDYQAALDRLKMIFNARPGTPEGMNWKFSVFSLISMNKSTMPLNNPEPIEAIKFQMEQLGYSQSDLAKVVGLKSRASEILNKKRKLTLEIIRQLHQALGIPTDVLIQSY